MTAFHSTQSSSAIPRPMKDHASRFIDYLTTEKGLSPRTIQSYRCDLEQLRQVLDGRQLAAAKRRDIGQFIEQLLADRKPSSVRRMVATFKHFFRFLLIDGIIKIDPTNGIEAIKVGRVLPKALTVSEMSTLLEIDPSTGQSPSAEFRRLRNHAILELMYASGLRASEITDALLANLDLIAGSIVVRGKGNKERIVPFGKRAAEAMKQYLAQRQDSAVWLFIRRCSGQKLTREMVWHIVNGRSEAVGRHVSPHMLRHSCATHLMNGGANLIVVKQILGHVDISTTQRYTHVTIESVRKVYLRCHPRAAAARQLGLFNVSIEPRQVSNAVFPIRAAKIQAQREALLRA